MMNTKQPNIPHLEGKLLHLHSIGYFGRRIWVEKYVIVLKNILIVSASEEDCLKRNYALEIDLLDVDVFAASLLRSSKQNVFKLSNDNEENIFACESRDACNRWSKGLLLLKNHWTKIRDQNERRGNDSPRSGSESSLDTDELSPTISVNVSWPESDGVLSYRFKESFEYNSDSELSGSDHEGNTDNMNQESIRFDLLYYDEEKSLDLIELADVNNL